MAFSPYSVNARVLQQRQRHHVHCLAADHLGRLEQSLTERAVRQQQDARMFSTKFSCFIGLHLPVSFYYSKFHATTSSINRKILIRGGCLDIHPLSRYNEISQKAHRLPSEEDFLCRSFRNRSPFSSSVRRCTPLLKFLQLDVCQLQSYINTALLENPTLECGAAPGVSLLDDLSAGGHAAAGEDAEHMQPDFADRDAVAYGEDLTTHLQFQAERLSLEPELQRAVLAVIHALDADGYLRTDVSALGPAALVDAAVQIVQRLDPPGVGARTLSECLCLQLQALGESGLACTIAEHYLEQAGHHAFAAIAASEHVPLAAVQEAYRQIQSLSPYPCAEFSRAQDDGYVVPDVLLAGKRRRAQRRRQQGLHAGAVRQQLLPLPRPRDGRSGGAAVYRQKGLAGGMAHQLHPAAGGDAPALLSGNSEAAAAVFSLRAGARSDDDAGHRAGRRPAHLHRQPRAQRKVYPDAAGRPLLRSLFSAKLAGGEVSGVMAQQAIAVLVQQEDKHAPLSDQVLAERLQAQGIDISRRTVAKYRQLLQIPSAATRRA